MAETKTAATGVKGALTKKIGPAPVYVWAIVGVVGYYLYRHYSGGGAVSSLAATPTTAASPTSDTTGATGGGVSGGGTSAGFTAQDVGAIVQPFADFSNSLLGYNGQLEQSIIASYLPTAPAASGETGPTAPPVTNNYYTTTNNYTQSQTKAPPKTITPPKPATKLTKPVGKQLGAGVKGGFKF